MFKHSLVLKMSVDSYLVNPGHSTLKAEYKNLCFGPS